MELLEKQDYLANVMLMEKCETDEDKIKKLEKIQNKMKSKEEQEKVLYYFVNVYGRTLKLEDKKRLDEYLERPTIKSQAIFEKKLKNFYRKICITNK